MTLQVFQHHLKISINDGFHRTIQAAGPIGCMAMNDLLNNSGG
jgi:hypothetical protein